MINWGTGRGPSRHAKTTKRPKGDHLAPDWLGSGKHPITGYTGFVPSNKGKYYGQWGELLNEI